MGTTPDIFESLNKSAMWAAVQKSGTRLMLFACLKLQVAYLFRSHDFPFHQHVYICRILHVIILTSHSRCLKNQGYASNLVSNCAVLYFFFSCDEVTKVELEEQVQNQERNL